jgi:T5SS/PEP-CTERM-associated repeat protein
MAPNLNARIGTPWLNFARRAAALLFLALAGSSAAHAQLAWVGNTSTDWTDATNWNPAVTPDITQAVLIDTGSGNQPVLSGNVGSANIVTIGTDANSTANTSLTLNTGANLTANNVILGANVLSFGTANFTDAGTIANISQNLTVGSSGFGNLTIANGAFVTDDQGFIGASSGANGTAAVTGANSTWISNTQLTVGNTGNGSLTISAGANVTTGAGSIGAAAASSGIVSVTDPSSLWNTTGQLSVGNLGNASLTIANGASVTDATGLIGVSAGANGAVTVTGANSTWTSTTLLSVGSAGNGTLNIASGATVSSSANITVSAPGGGSTGVINLANGTLSATLITVDNGGTLAGNGTILGNTTVTRGTLSPTNLLSFNQTLTITNNAATINFPLGGNTSGTYAAIATGGNLTLAGKAVISLTNGFVPSLGDTFFLLQAGNLAGAFNNISTPSFPAGMGFDTSRLATTGTVTVITVFSTEPTNQFATTGQSATFTVASNSNPPPTFQWQASNDNGNTWQNIVDGTDPNTHVIYSGSTTGSLTVSNASALANGLEFRAVASNPNAVSSAASLLVGDTWLGANTTAWVNAENWNPQVPLTTDNVNINIGNNNNLNKNNPKGNLTVIAATSNITINDIIIGNDVNSTSPSLTVTGGGALNANIAIVGNGQGSTGILAVASPANLTTNSTIIGNLAGSTGTVTLATRSLWVNTGDILVGNLGEGTVTATSSNITAGGNIAIGGIGTLRLTTSTVQANGTISIANGGQLLGKGNLITSNFISDGIINPSPSSSASAVPSGLFVFSKDLTLTSNSNVTIALTGTTRGTQFSGLNVTGNLTANGLFNLTTPYGYTPTLGQTYNILQVGGNYSGNFTSILIPFEPDGLGWDLSNLTVNGNITVVSVITTQPTDQFAQLFQSANFTVATSGTPTPTYQWQVNTEPTNFVAFWQNITDGLDPSTGIIYSGSTTATLNVSNVSASVSGFQYRAVLTNPAAAAVSDFATLTVDAILDWTGNTSTDWTDATNWNPAFVPDITLTALINTGSGNQPMLSGNAIANVVIVGNDANSTANTSLTLNAGGNLTTNNLYLGYNSNGTGTAVVTDATTLGNISQTVAVGWNGTGTLTVANGANLTDALGYIGANAGSTGTATITGTNSTWNNTGELNVGYVGNGTLNVANGATVFAPSLIAVSALGGSTGLINLSNATLSVTPLSGNAGLIVVNSNGTLAGNGTILGPTTVAGTLSPNGLMNFSEGLSLTANATVNFSLGGNTTGTYGAITANSSIVFGGTVVIALANGFVPSIGDNFTLFQTGGTFISTFTTVIPPAIPGGLGLDTSSLSLNGTVTAISVITSQTPADGNETLSETQSGNLSIVAPDALKFQWQESLDGGVTWTDLTDKSDSHITGTKTDTLNLIKVTLDMSGREFRCLVTTSVAIAFSNTFILTVIPSFTVVSQPVSQSVYINTPVTFSVDITSPLSPVTTQWYKNGKLIAGANTPTLNLGDVTKANNGTYTAVVSYAGNATINATSIGSNLAVLTVAKVPAKVVIQPLKVTTKVGRTIYFRAYANGDQTKTFQWQFSATGTPPWNNLTNGTGTIIGNVTVSGATSTGGSYTTLRLTGVNDNDDVGFYRLMVSNPANIAISGTAAFSKAVSLTVTN